MLLSTVDGGIQPVDDFIAPLDFLSALFGFICRKIHHVVSLFHPSLVSEFFAFSIDFLVIAMKMKLPLIWIVLLVYQFFGFSS